jgi:adenylosuccinate synthase
MPVIALIGAQWGDEGKGKVVDVLSEKVKAIVRFNGGNNAGHTVINHFGEFPLHLVPSGIFWPHTICVIGSGVAVNPAVLLDEIKSLNNKGVDTSRLYISDRANVIMPYHIMLDGLEEKSKGGQAVGTTGNGIGPVFSDKFARIGIRIGELLKKDSFGRRLRPILEHKNAILTKVYGAKPLSFDEVLNKYSEYGEKLAPLVRETTLMLDEMLIKGEKILLEGAQGTLLDPDFGSYPYTTSSSSVVAGAFQGSGIAPRQLTTSIGIFKAYCSRVGAGPFPTEMKDAMGNFLRERAHEYGATTGRPRRCGWFDGVVSRFSTRINGFSQAAITRLDILDVFEKIKLCTGYKLDGKIVTNVPANIDDLERCEAVYEELPGWMTPISNIKNYNDLPQRAKDYLGRLEELIGCPISLVSVGPAREQSIFKTPMVE